MGTVGFGDLVPYSLFGRLIVVITSIWGALLIAIVVMVLKDLFTLSINQKKAMHRLFLTRKAASTITSAMRYYIQLSKHKQHIKKSSDNLANFRTFLDDEERSSALHDKLQREAIRKSVHLSSLKKNLDTSLLDFANERSELRYLKI